jgi:hypothetical protein
VGTGGSSSIEDEEDSSDGEAGSKDNNVHEDEQFWEEVN